MSVKLVAFFLTLARPGLALSGQGAEHTKTFDPFYAQRRAKSVQDQRALTLRALDPEAISDRIRAAQPKDRQPVDAIRALVDDRARNGPLDLRASAAYVAGDWPTYKQVLREVRAAILGHAAFELTQAFASGQEMADRAAPALQDVSTLLLVFEPYYLGGEGGALAALRSRGFEIRPVALPKR